MEVAGGLSGGGQEDSALLEALCEAAIERWKQRLREGVAPEDCGSAFVCAAAFTAAANFACGGGGVESFSAGEISVKGRGAAQSAAVAEKLRQAAEELMAPYVHGAEFAFQGVRG